MQRLAWVSSVFFLAACQGVPPSTDASVLDASLADASLADASWVDAPLADGSPADAAPPVVPLRDRIREGAADGTVTPRPGHGALIARAVGARTAVLEVLLRADGTHVRRVRSGAIVRDEAVGEVFHDVALHPSGDLTIAIERSEVGYELLRLDAVGAVRVRQPLPVGATLPSADLGTLPTPPWRLRANPDHPLLAGWIRLVATGEDLALTWLSRVDANTPDLVSGVASARWTGARFEERFTRVVDGRHFAMPPAWQYDELRFADALLRPLIAVDPTDGTILVGRTWTVSRCRVVSSVFGGLDPAECYERTTPNGESRALTFAYTAFSAEGVRGATRSFIPRSPYFHALFGMAAHGGQVAVAGVTSVQAEDGSVAFYDGDRVPFDGVVAVLERDSGAVRWEKHVDRGRADLFSAIAWTPEGLVAVGCTDWDRWNGGMSISRGGDAWITHFDASSGEATVRVFERAGTDRHRYFFDVAVSDTGNVLAVGLDDAPLTHSGDGGRKEEMTFGSFVVSL